MADKVGNFAEEQIITGYPIDGAMVRLGGGRVRKLSDVCCERHTGYECCIVGHMNRLSAIYIVSSVGTSLLRQSIDKYLIVDATSK